MSSIGIMKLELRDRIQAVIFAYETGMNRPVRAGKALDDLRASESDG